MPEAIPLIIPRVGGQVFTLPVHQGLRATDSPLTGPGCPSTMLCQGHFSQSRPATPAMLRTQILQAPGAITPDHLKARTTGHLTNESVSSHPCRGHHHAPTSWPPPPQHESDCRAHHLPAQRAAPASHLGGHHHTKVGVSPSDTRARKTTLLGPDPRCPRPRHGCHPSPSVPGAPRIPHLSRARAAAAPPPADPSGGPLRALDTAQLPRRSHRTGARGPARRARVPLYLQPAAGLGPPPPPRPPPPSWAPQGPDSLTPLPQGAGAGAKAASAPRGTLRPLRKPHSAASGDHGDGRGVAAPPGAREGSGAEARESGVFRGLGPGAWGRWAPGFCRRWSSVGGREGYDPPRGMRGSEPPGSPSCRPRVTGFSVGEGKKKACRITGELVHLGGGKRELDSTSSGCRALLGVRGMGGSQSTPSPSVSSRPPPCWGPAQRLASKRALGQF